MKRKASEIAAARKVLRNLSRPDALRWNPLLQPLFTAAESDDASALRNRIKTLITASVRSLRPVGPATKDLHAMRQYAILSQYDLRNQPRDVIARTLNISLRQFYYERRAALARFADALHAMVLASAHSPVEVTTSSYETEERHARSLLQVGEFDLAADLFTRLARNATDDSQRVRMLCLLIDTFCEAARTDEASEVYEELSQILRSGAFEERQAGNLQVLLDYANLQITCQRGQFARALKAADRARENMRTSRPDSEASRMAHARLLGTIATIQRFLGHISEAITSCSQAISMVENAGSAGPLLAELLWQQGGCYSERPDGFAAARARNAQALDVAMRYNDLHVMARAHCDESFFQYRSGSLGAALKHGRTAMAIMNTISGPEERAMATLSFARIEAAAGNKHQGLRRAREARRHLPASCYLWAFSYMVESEIFLLLNDCERAIKSADIALRRSRRAGCSRGVGSSIRLIAEAQWRLGRVGDARHAINEAIHELERAGDPFWLAAAYERSGHIGNRNHLAKAADLRALFAQAR